MAMTSWLRKFRYMQYVCTFIVSLLHAALSMVSAWMSPVLPHLTSEETPLDSPLTDFEQMWVVSGEKLGAVIGCILAAFLTDRIGRKLVLLIATTPFVITMTAITFTKSVIVFIILRVIGGVGEGVIFAILPVYIAEVSDNDIRGQLGVIRLILGTLGGVYVYSVGPFVSYVALSLSIAIFSFVFIILFLFMPETPYYLVKKGNFNSARKSLKQLSLKELNDDVIESKLQEIRNFVDRDVKHKGYLKELFLDRANRKAFFITLVMRTVLIFSGVFVLMTYLQKLIEDSASSISPEVSSIIFGIINLPSALLAAYFIDKTGRRPLYLISTIGCAIALISVGIYFYLQEHGSVNDILWLPTTGLCAFILFAFLGINALPAVMQGEMFSINVKSKMSSFIMIYGSATSFIMLMFFQSLADKLGMYVMFWFFGGVCVLGCLFGYFVLPETKGKTFLEIQDLLSNQKRDK